MLVTDENFRTDVQSLMFRGLRYGLLHTIFFKQTKNKNFIWLFLLHIVLLCLRFVPSFSFADILTCCTV